MKTLPSRFRRLDGALAALPLDEPMLLTELDGLLTGILVGPEPVPRDEWLELVWGVDDGTPPFEEPADVQWFADAVMARYEEIRRDLVRGKPKPIFDVDDRTGDVLWEAWIDGFSDAIALRPDRWSAWSDQADPATAEALSTLSGLLAIARDESDLDSLQINALDATAPARIGRNDPCPCGSGAKFKRCCA